MSEAANEPSKEFGFIPTEGEIAKALAPKFQAIGKVSAATLQKFDLILNKKDRKRSSGLKRPANASNIKPKAVGWAYKDWLTTEAVGYVHGDGGAGKSTILLWFAARISNGEIPGRFEGVKRNIAVVRTEDPEHLVRTRFEKMGGNPEYLHIWNEAQDANGEAASLDLFNIESVKSIAEWLQEDDFGLVIVDNQSEALNIENTNARNDVYYSLNPLSALCRDLDLSVQVIGHDNKTSTTDSVTKAAGNKAYQNAVRTMYHVIRDPDEPDVRYLCATKNSFGDVFSLGAMKFRMKEGEYESVELTSDGTEKNVTSTYGYVEMEEVTEEVGINVARRLLHRENELSRGKDVKHKVESPKTCLDYLKIILVRAAASNEKLSTTDMHKRVNEMYGSNYSLISIRKAKDSLELSESKDGRNKTFWLEGQALETVRAEINSSSEPVEKESRMDKFQGLLDD